MVLSSERKNNLKNYHRWIAFLAIAGVSAAALLVLRMNHPHEVSAIPECPSISLMGLYCPGCGSLRATHHLLHGRVDRSLAQNPMMLFIGVPVLLLGSYLLMIWAIGRPSPAWSRSRTMAWLLISAGGVLLLFGVLRNFDTEWTRWLQPQDQRVRS